MGAVHPQMAPLHLRIGFRPSHMKLFRMMVLVKELQKRRRRLKKETIIITAHVLVHLLKSFRAYNVKYSSTLFLDNIQ